MDEKEIITSVSQFEVGEFYMCEYSEKDEYVAGDSFIFRIDGSRKYRSELDSIIITIVDATCISYSCGKNSNLSSIMAGENLEFTDNDYELEQDSAKIFKL